MTAKFFVDTNILLYAAGGRQRFPQKYQKAWNLIETGEFALSAQVLSEFYVNATRKSHIALTPSQIDEWVARLTLAPVVPVDAHIVAVAIAWSRQFQISYWDAAVLAAARRLDLKTVYSEDLNHGQFYGSVQVIDPFKQHPTQQ